MTTMRMACTSALLACVSGCMVTPFDGQEVADTRSPIEFSGYTLKPNQDVRIYSVEHASDLLVGTTRTVEAPIAPFPGDATQFYPWRLTAVVPEWTGVGANGRYALVTARALEADGSELALPTARPNGVKECSASRTPLDALLCGRAPSSPRAFLYTPGTPPTNFSITRLYWSAGTLWVSVLNSGRAGMVRNIRCYRGFETQAATFDRLQGPWEDSYEVPLPPGPPALISCVLAGANADGSPELDLSDNSRRSTL